MFSFFRNPRQLAPLSFSFLLRAVEANNPASKTDVEKVGLYAAYIIPLVLVGFVCSIVHNRRRNQLQQPPLDEHLPQNLDQPLLTQGMRIN